MRCLILSVLALCAIGASAQTCVSKGNGYYVNATDCQRYYRCINNVMTTFDCRTSNAGFARDLFCGTSQQKLAIVNSPTVNSIQNPNRTWRNQCTAVGWLADSRSCNRYFRCHNQNGRLVHTVMYVNGMCANSEYVTRCTRGRNRPNNGGGGAPGSGGAPGAGANQGNGGAPGGAPGSGGASGGGGAPGSGGAPGGGGAPGSGGAPGAGGAPGSGGAPGGGGAPGSGGAPGGGGAPGSGGAPGGGGAPGSGGAPGAGGAPGSGGPPGGK